MFSPKYDNLASSASARSAFSITETLACIAILGIMVAVSVPALTGLVRGNDVSSSLQVIAGVLESARQQAIASNTYVWVAFSDADPSDQNSKLCLLVAGSRTGEDVLPWTNEELDLATVPELQMLDKVYFVSGVKLIDPDGITVGEVIETPPTNVQNLREVAWKFPVAGTSRRFTCALQFSPAGESRLDGLTRSVELGISQTLGDSGNAAIIRVAGITGKARTLR